MTGSDQHEQKALIDHAESLGWRSEGPNKRGYFKIMCPCGNHQLWVHKTPSNPNYWAERRRQIARVCPPEQLNRRLGNVDT